MHCCCSGEQNVAEGVVSPDLCASARSNVQRQSDDDVASRGCVDRPRKQSDVRHWGRAERMPYRATDRHALGEPENQRAINRGSTRVPPTFCVTSCALATTTDIL